MHSPPLPRLPEELRGPAAPAASDSTADALPALVRLAERLLPDATPVLYLEGEDPELAWWPGGAEGRAWPHPSAELRALCERVARGEERVQVARLRDERAPGGSGAAGFAGVPLRCAGRRGAVGVLVVADRFWSEAEVGCLADLAELASAQFARRRSGFGSDMAVALARSEGRYRELVHSCPAGIFRLSPAGRLYELNPAAAEIAGRPAAELEGVQLQEVVAPEDVEVAEEALRRAAAGGDPRNEIEIRVVRPSGERRLVHLICMATEQEGRVVWLQGLARDITDERARELQLRRAERMATVAPLLSGVCHELNNPLTSIKSFAELLLLDDRPAEDREALEIVQREAHRAAKIVSDLRVVARQSQEAGTGRGVVDVNDVVRHVVELRGEGLAGRRVEVRLDLAERLPPVWAVRAHLEQVVGELIGNADLAMSEQAEPRRLRLHTFRGDLGVAVVVEDTGPGIAPEHVDRIFDPFWTTRRAGEGTGLGLSLVNSIVTEHGGRVRVDSQPGRGAAFTVELPPSETETPAVTPGAGESGPASRGLRILVVDDEAPIRFSLARYMERRGHQVSEAAEGGEALKLLEASTGGQGYDIIVADLRMPGLNGEQLHQRLRARGDGLDQRLIFITGDAESPDVEGVLRDAGVPVVWKPFELAEVAQIIEAQAGMSTS